MSKEKGDKPHDLTPDEEEIGLQIPETPTLESPSSEKQGKQTDDRVQVNLSRYLVEVLIRAWLSKGVRSGTIKDICERSIRLWLTIFGNVSREGSAVHFTDSQTGQDLSRLADRLDGDHSGATSRSVKEAYIVRIGAHIATSLLKYDGVQNPDRYLLHELFAAGQKRKLLIGDEIADRLRLAAEVLKAPSDMTVKELLKKYQERP